VVFLNKGVKTLSSGVYMLEIRFHGRGGQGAITAAEILASAVFREGKYAQAFGAFGPERRGAPVMAFVRISEKPIRLRQQIYNPDMIVVLDPGLIGVIDVVSGLKKRASIVVNSPEKLTFDVEDATVHTVDATRISQEVLGKPIVNTAMLGAFAKATGLVSLEHLKQAVAERFSGELGEKNIKAVERAYNETGE
jgi:2-oxoacid:acceptor oxidoreductase gamma subunit (pyruvate/2-ketoisovalerate family)